MFLGRAFMVKTIWGRWVGGKGFSPAGPPKNGIGLRNTKNASPIARIAPSYGPILPLIIGLSTQKGGTPDRVLESSWSDFAVDKLIIDTKRGHSSKRVLDPCRARTVSCVRGDRLRPPPGIHACHEQTRSIALTPRGTPIRSSVVCLIFKWIDEARRFYRLIIGLMVQEGGTPARHCHCRVRWTRTALHPSTGL